MLLTLKGRYLSCIILQRLVQHSQKKNEISIIPYNIFRSPDLVETILRNFSIMGTDGDKLKLAEGTEKLFRHNTFVVRL